MEPRGEHFDAHIHTEAAEKSSDVHPILERAINDKPSTSKEEVQSTIERLHVPFVTASGESLVRSHLATLDEQDEANVATYIGEVIKSYGSEGLDFPEELLENVHNWKRADQLSITVPGAGFAVGVQEIMPPGYNIYVREAEKFINAGVIARDRTIFINGGYLSSPIAVLSLLHEIGHAWDFVHVANGSAGRVRDVAHADIAETLRSERVANAFALKAVRSFMKHDDPLIKDAKVFLKDYSLHGYNLSAQKQIAHREQMAITAREMGKDYDDLGDELEEWAKWDEYMAWTATDEYKAWKQLDANKSLEDDQEYGAWLDWCEVNGRAWWKVLPPE
jgi:hypothetical protein